jgi:hypothetical protein
MDYNAPLDFPLEWVLVVMVEVVALALLCIGEVKMKLESCDKLHIYVVVLNPETIIMRCGVSLGSTVSRKESFTIVVGI